MIRVYTIIFLLCVVFTNSKAEIVFDVTDISNSFLGFGAQIWPGDMRIEQLFTDLNMKYIRMCSVGCNNPPADATQAQIDTYVDSEYNNTNRGNAITSSLQMAQTNNITVILNKFGGLSDWLGTNNRLLSQYFDDFAKLWASEVLFFKNKGLDIHYIELFNEPEGDWNIKVLPADYNTIVKLVRAELDSRGLSDVGIIGPGLAYLYHGPSWINALDSDGKNALAAWSTHAWDEGWGHTDAEPNFIDQGWQEYFGQAINTVDPNHTKPIIVTEYATGVKTYNGVTFGDDVCETNQFAQRSFENSLTLVNNGANVLCYWEAASQRWQSDPMFGLIRTDSTMRPVYYAFSTISPHIPDNAMVLRKTWDDPIISAAGFVSDNKLVLAFANSSEDTQDRTISITGITNFNITSIEAFDSGLVINKTSDFSYDFVAGNMNISLPPETTLTIVADVNQCNLAGFGDISGDCKIDFSDFSMVASDWMKTSTPTPQGQTIEDFQAYPDSASMLEKWIPTDNVSLTLATNVSHNGGKSMKYQYNNGSSPYYSKAMYFLAPTGSGVDWTDFDTLTLWFKCTVAKEPMQVNIVNRYGINILTVPYGTPQVADWVRWDIDLTGIDQNQLKYIGRVDMFFTSTYYSSGTVYFDDIILYDSNNIVSNETMNSDLNSDGVVDFGDIMVLGDNWLKCTLIE